MNNTRLFVPFAEGFEEMEAMTIVDVLRRAGINVDMVGMMGTMVTGSHGIRVTMDKKLIEVRADDYNGLVIPGGNPGCINLGRSSAFLDLVKSMYNQGKLVAAISNAPSLLAKIGILENKRATIYPGMEKELPHPRDQKVVTDGKVITSQSPGTAIEFALKIAEVLVGKDVAASIRRSIAVSEV